jgi:hypothetical protein
LIIQTRLPEATRCPRETDARVAAVAPAYGFYDHRAFARQFQAATGDGVGLPPERAVSERAVCGRWCSSGLPPAPRLSNVAAFSMPIHDRPRPLLCRLVENGRVAATTTAGWIIVAAAPQGRVRSSDLS